MTKDEILDKFEDNFNKLEEVINLFSTLNNALIYNVENCIECDGLVNLSEIIQGKMDEIFLINEKFLRDLYDDVYIKSGKVT